MTAAHAPDARPLRLVVISAGTSVPSSTRMLADRLTSATREALARHGQDVDVTVLDEWLDRNEAYDVALRGLYVALEDVGGRVTDDVRDAIAAEKAAKERLPPDSRGLILIMAEIGRGGMNGAVIAIEETKGRLAATLEPAEWSDSAKYLCLVMPLRLVD